jgi:hypothetical protein
MIIAALLPLAWALAGLVVVIRLAGDHRPPTEDGARIAVTGRDHFRPAA